MCTRPILIKNRKYLNLDFNFSKSFVKVPCGECEECLHKRANDIYVRAFYEYQYCLENGGCGFICTLTYDDNNVPVLFHLGKKYMVFNKQDVINFIKRLRTCLDREYNSIYRSSAPDFKYLVTSEYGSNPYCSHRPHYHLLFFFKDCITPSVFRRCFQKSLYNRITGKRYFGKIYQCDLIKPEKGGIKYSCKYILKDMLYNHTESIIKDRISFEKYSINKQFNIKDESTYFNRLHNKCIRTTKEYKSKVVDSVRFYSHMLQFYMCSNDLGCSAILNRYGNSLFSFCHLNINGFPFSIPKQVYFTLERTKGSIERDRLSKSVFLNYLSSQLSRLVDANKICKSLSDDYLSFAKENLVFKYGSFYFASEYISGYLNYPDSPTLFDEYTTFFEKGFIEKRDQLIRLISSFDNVDSLKFRDSVAKRNKKKQDNIYYNKKRNNSFNYGIF